MRLRQISVLAFAGFVAVLVLLSAYFTERNGLVDEPGFLNPPYMLAHYGKLTFPTYPNGLFFDVPVVTHPPVHVAWIGLLWRMGMRPYYAEATPTVLLFLLAILIIAGSAFPTPVKLGWLFSIGFLATSGETLTMCFGTRPEGELLAAWFCGLLLLESGRLDNWKRWRLFAGSLFLVWAAGTHYYGVPALFGIAVYMLWAVRSMGWPAAKPTVVAMGAGGCVYGLPYLLFYVLPYFTDIRAAIRGNQGAGGIGLAIQRHMAMYKYWVLESYHPILIRKAMALGVPFWALSTALLAAVRTTRGIALASLPLQLGIFFFAWHKMPYYMVHESVLFAAALSVALLALGHFLIHAYLPKLEPIYAPAAVAVLCFCLISGSPMLAHADLSLQPRFNEVEVAQAAGRRIMGPHARIGGVWWGWHSAGAEHWYDVERDLTLKYTLFDPATYISNPDAFQICAESSEGNDLHKWYADGSLKLRGFFFGQSNMALRCLQLSPRPTSPLVGYAEWNDQLYRFQENSSGDYEVLSAICPSGVPDDWHSPWNGSFSFSVGLASPSMRLVTALAPLGRAGQGCRTIARTRGSLQRDDRRALVEWARRNDAPIQFHRGLDEMPGYKGIGLPPEAIAPPDAVRVENIVDLKAIEAVNGGRVDRSSGVRVTTIALPGAFSAALPVRNAQTVAGPCWVVLKLRVREGRVGFAAAAEGGRLLAQTQGIAPSPEVQSVALKVLDFREARSVIIYNQSQFGGQVDIVDASVVVVR
ncbi:MAG: hypothetical protein ABI806_05265 [Candidatus Solibacter sp.]